MAGRYFCRPSEYLGLTGWEAMAVDEECFDAGQSRLALSLGTGGMVFPVLPLR